MSGSRAAQIVHDYFSGHVVGAFADDATFEFIPLGRTVTGVEQIQEMLAGFYRDAFPGATVEDVRFVDGENSVVVEWTFRGTNTGTLSGTPPTGRSVAVRMIGVYEVEDGKIQRARVYWDAADFTRQLGSY